MKTIIAILISIGINYSQSYTYGVYTEQTIYSSAYASTGNCGSDPDITINDNIQPYVSGMELKLKVTSVSSGVKDELNNSVQVDDIYSLPISFYFTVSGSIYYDIIAQGTPTISGEQYYCDDFTMFITMGECFNTSTLEQVIPEKNCVVLGSVGNMELEKNEPEIESIYDLIGKPIESGYKGISIIRYSNGTTKKVYHENN